MIEIMAKALCALWAQKWQGMFIYQKIEFKVVKTQK
jgi:hypothetical protein